jgi:hypothetical protein
MRRTVTFALLVASACTPDIVAGAYYCGPEQLCPDHLECDGETNICVARGVATEFACGPTTESEPNNSFATAESVGDIQCASRLEAMGCVLGDEDYFGFTVPASCTPRKVTARVSYPVAFEPVVVEVVDGTNVLATSEPCASGITDDIGSTEACVEATVAPGGIYALRLAGTGSENCAGACAFNRYALTIQLLAQ